MTDKLTILQGDVRETLSQIESGSVNTCVTSPPYFGLRSYNGGAAEIGQEQRPDCLGWATGEPCGACYVCTMVAVFRDVRRVLRDDGTLWVNLGDSYANDGKWGSTTGGKHANGLHGEPVGRQKRKTGFKPKDLMGIPWRVAMALQADGWFLRSDCIWSKGSCMPESVTDRPAKSHEYLFLLSKKERYFYDHEAVKEPKAAATVSDSRTNTDGLRRDRGFPGSPSNGGTNMGGADGGRNKRTVWTVNPAPYKDCHFATYPPELIKPCILAGCPAGGLVLDPFGGSGTTAMVAMMYGRRAILCELNPEYIELARRRCLSAEAQEILAL